MRLTPLLRAASVLCLVVGAAACGGDSDEKTEAELVDDISEVLQGDGQLGLDEDQAECWAEIIVDEAGADALNDLDLSESEPPTELQEQITAAAQRAVEDCGITGSGG
jgi:hypothetical protein